MSRVTKAWSFAGLGLAGLGLCFVEPLVGVPLCVVATFASSFTGFSLNVPATRQAQLVAVGAHALALYVAARSIELSLALLICGLVTLPTETAMVRLRRGFMLEPLAGGLVSAALLALAWPKAQLWVLGAAPQILFFGLFIGYQLVRVRNRSLATLGRSKLRVGEALPELCLPRRDGSGDVDFAQERGRALLVLFVRGDWCPVCHVLMRVVAREQRTLLDKGVKLFVISPAEGDLDTELGQQMQLESQLLLDRDATVARRLGLLEGDDPDSPSPLPIAVLVDADGVIRDITSPQDVTDYSSSSRIAVQLQLLPSTP